MDFKNFTAFMETAKDMDGKLSDEASQAALTFYQYWGNYLAPIPAFMSFLLQPVGGFAKGLYLITNSLEKVFNNLFKLFGLFGYLSNKETTIGQFYYYLQIVGVGLFTMLIIWRFIFSVIGKRMKYKEVVNHFILVTIVVAVLPWAITQVSTAMAKDMQSVQTAGDVGGDYSSLAIQPLKNNVVDLKVLIDNDFDIEKFPLDDTGFIKPVQQDSTPVNNITDATSERDSPDFATRIDFSAVLGVMDTKQLEKMNDDKEGIKGLLLHKINSMQDGVNVIDEHRFTSSFNAFEYVYPRYKVNWLGMIAQYFVLIILLIMMSIKFVKSIYETILTSIIAPIQGYSSTESSKKFKELILTIVGAFAGIFFEVVIMRVTLEVMRDLPTLTLSGVAGLTGDFFDGLNMWEQCLTSIVVYLGMFFGAMQGVTIIERWLGVSTGQSDTMQQMMATMMMGNALGSGASAATHGMLGVGGTALSAAKSAPQTLARAGQGFAGTAGGLSGVVQSVKDQGLKDTAKAGFMNAGNKTAEKVGGITSRAGAALDRSMEKGYQSTRGAFHDANPSLDKMPIQTNESLEAGYSRPPIASEPGTRNEDRGSRADLGVPNAVPIPSTDNQLPQNMGADTPTASGDHGTDPISASDSSLGNSPAASSSDGATYGSGSAIQSGESSHGERGGVSPTSSPAQPQRQPSGQGKGLSTRAGQQSTGLTKAKQASQGDQRTKRNIPNSISKDGGIKTPSTTRSGQATHYQKAGQNLQQMKNGIDQGTQKMSAGSSRSHIRGAEVDEE